jgi:ferredoxin-NADP reductase
VGRRLSGTHFIQYWDYAGVLVIVLCMKLTLRETKQEAPGVVSFIFEPSEPRAWKAGQYMQVMLPHDAADERGAERWFTISSAPYEGRPTITTRFDPVRSSTFKKTLAAMGPGESLESEYVDGDFTVDDASKQYVFIAGGIGITPFHSILKQADHDGVALDVQLLYANRDGNVIFKDELESFAQKNPRLKIHYITNPARIDEALVRELVPDLRVPLLYLSGPEPMVKSLQQMLVSMGVAPEHIKLDDFPGYEVH